MEEEERVRAERLAARGTASSAAAAPGPSLMAAYDDDQDQVF
jgi:hypothetical protein